MPDTPVLDQQLAAIAEKVRSQGYSVKLRQPFSLKGMVAPSYDISELILKAIEDRTVLKQALKDVESHGEP